MNPRMTIHPLPTVPAPTLETQWERRNERELTYSSPIAPRVPCRHSLTGAAPACLLTIHVHPTRAPLVYSTPLLALAMGGGAASPHLAR